TLSCVGVVLFEVTTGRHPFASCRTTDEMIDAHLHQPPPRPSHLRARVSPFLETVLLDLLQEGPDRRERHAGQLSRLRVASRLPPPPPAETPYVGRSDELALLDGKLARARKGQGGAVVVAGPE